MGRAAAVAATGCIPRLVHLLHYTGSEDVAFCLAGAVAGLISGSPSTASAVELASGRAALQVHAGSSNEHVREAADGVLLLLNAHSAEPAAGGEAPNGAQPAAAAEVPPAAQPAPLLPAPRVCAAEGCSNATGLRRCGGCARVRYCSTDCRDAHWRAHRRECKRWRAEAAAAEAATSGVPPVQP